MKPVQKLALAMSYVTSIRLIDTAAFTDETAFAGLSKYLPSVGLVLGSILFCSSRILAHLHVNFLLASALFVVLWLLLTGGLHMDGLMDAADGVFSHQSKERILEIMKDSRAGNFAVLAALCALAIKIFSLSTLTTTTLPAAVFLTPALSRACEVFAIGRFQYARSVGKGKIWHDTTRFPADFFASLLPVVVAAIVCGFFSGFGFVLALCSGTMLGGICLSYWLNEKVGGHTGDTYGACVELAEVAGVLAAAIFAS